MTVHITILRFAVSPSKMPAAWQHTSQAFTKTESDLLAKFVTKYFAILQVCKFIPSISTVQAHENGSPAHLMDVRRPTLISIMSKCISKLTMLRIPTNFPAFYVGKNSNGKRTFYPTFTLTRRKSHTSAPPVGRVSQQKLTWENMR